LPQDASELEINAGLNARLQEINSAADSRRRLLDNRVLVETAAGSVFSVEAFSNFMDSGIAIASMASGVPSGKMMKAVSGKKQKFRGNAKKLVRGLIHLSKALEFADCAKSELYLGALPINRELTDDEWDQFSDSSSTFAECLVNAIDKKAITKIYTYGLKNTAAISKDLLDMGNSASQEAYRSSLLTLLADALDFSAEFASNGRVEGAIKYTESLLRAAGISYKVVDSASADYNQKLATIEAEYKLLYYKTEQLFWKIKLNQRLNRVLTPVFLTSTNFASPQNVRYRTTISWSVSWPNRRSVAQQSKPR